MTVLTGRRLTLVFGGLMVGQTMAGLDATIVATAGQSIVGDIGSQHLLPWVFTAYQLAQLALMPLYGKLGDLLGRRRVYTTAVMLFVVGSVLAGASQSMSAFIGARVIQGLGAGGVNSLSVALIADIAPPEKHGRFIGYTGFVFAVTSVIGPLAGGLFVDHLSWRWAFYVNLPSAMVCMAAIRFVPRLAARRDVPIDFLGAALLGAIATAAVLALSWGGSQYAWSSATMLGLFVAVSVLAVAAYAWERRAAEPIIPARVFRERQVRICVFGNLVGGIGFFAGIVYLPIFSQAVAGKGATAAGYLLIPFALTTALTTASVGNLVHRTGRARVFLLIGMAAMACGYTLLSRVTATTPAVVAALAGMIVGIGIGCVLQLMLFVVQRSVPRADLGAATAVTIFARIFGSVVGVAVLGNVFNQRLADELRQRVPSLRRTNVRGTARAIRALARTVQPAVHSAFAHAISTTFLVAVPVMIVGFVVTVRLPEHAVRARIAAGGEMRAEPAAFEPT